MRIVHEESGALAASAKSIPTKDKSLLLPCVLLVDDHVVVANALFQLLNDTGAVRAIGPATCFKEADALCSASLPDVVLMDVDMPQTDGITATRLLREKFPTLRVVMFSGAIRAASVAEAKRAGAIGFIHKSISINELTSAITLAAAGKESFPECGSRAESPALSRREQQTLSLLCDGYTAKETASRLALSCRTVDAYRRTLMRKARVRNAVALVRFAIQQGYVRS